jgi:hypothetical protein
MDAWAELEYRTWVIVSVGVPDAGPSATFPQLLHTAASMQDHVIIEETIYASTTCQMILELT